MNFDIMPSERNQTPRPLVKFHLCDISKISNP
jgi:hypothetical protein